MARGNAENLRAAAQRKHQAALERAETGLKAMATSGEQVTFRGLAKRAGVSIDFLYRSPLRARVEQLRAAQQNTRPSARAPAPDQPPSQSSVVRALTVQLTELKRVHRTEIARLEGALAAAQGENLQLRRRLARHGPTPADEPNDPDLETPEQLIERGGGDQARDAAG